MALATVWFLEAGHTVLPKRLAMMLVRVEAGHTVLSAVIIIYQISNVEQHFFVAFFFLLSVKNYTLSRKKKKMHKFDDRALRNDFRPRFFVGMQNGT